MEEKHLKTLGVALMFIGLTMLLFTFYQAYVYLKTPIETPALESSSSVSGNSGMPDINKAIAQAFAPLFNSIVPLVYSTSYLFVMALVGFWIMGRGIQLVK